MYATHAIDRVTLEMVYEPRKLKEYAAEAVLRTVGREAAEVMAKIETEESPTIMGQHRTTATMTVLGVKRDK